MSGCRRSGISTASASPPASSTTTASSSPAHSPTSVWIHARTSIGSPPSPQESMQLFIEGKVDAFLAFPPQPQEMRAKKIGRVIVEHSAGSAMVAVLLLHARRQSTTSCEQHPVATKRADAGDPQGGGHLRQRARARRPLPRGQRATSHATTSALEVLKKLPYNRWRKPIRRTRCASMPCACTRWA